MGLWNTVEFAHVTNNIAFGLSTPLPHVKRIKILYGSAMPTPSVDHDIIRLQLIGEEKPWETHQVPRSALVGIIRPRIEETFEVLSD